MGKFLKNVKISLIFSCLEFYKIYAMNKICFHILEAETHAVLLCKCNNLLPYLPMSLGLSGGYLYTECN